METKKTTYKAKKKGSVTAPTKKTMNFVHHQSSFNMKKVAPTALALLVAIGIFAKFGILDPMDKKMEAYNALTQQQETLASINEKLTGYPELAREYGRYSYGWMNEEEVGMVSRMDVLGLVEEKIRPAAVIENMAVNNNVLTLNIHGLTLEQASGVVKNLETSPLVESASVYNAVAENAKDASIFMSVILTKEAE